MALDTTMLAADLVAIRGDLGHAVSFVWPDGTEHAMTVVKTDLAASDQLMDAGVNGEADLQYYALAADFQGKVPVPGMTVVDGNEQYRVLTVTTPPLSVWWILHCADLNS